jgi:cell division initiation protein
MDLTARDIHEKQFNDSWRGYNQEQVDEFLDRVADALDRLQRENSALNARVTELDHAVATSRDTEEMLKKTLITAQQAAEEAIASARAKAEALIQEAEERTRRVHREADEKLQSADAEARRKSLEADREHTIRKREIDASLEKLRRFESDLKRRLSAFLSDQTRGLERLTEEEPPKLEPRTPQAVQVQEEPQAQETPEVQEPDDEDAIAASGAPIMDEVHPEEGEEGTLHSAASGEATGQWIPDFLASRDEAKTNGDTSGSWEEPGFVHDTDLASLYKTASTDAAEANGAEDDRGQPRVETAAAELDDQDDAEEEDDADTVTLAEEETAAPRQRSRSLFWRGDG